MALNQDGHQNRPLMIEVASLEAPIPIIQVKVTGETYPRYVLLSNGTARTGNGSAIPT